MSSTLSCFPSYQILSQAVSNISPLISPSSLTPYPRLEKALGLENKLWIKWENELPTSSFKYRPALAALASLSDKQKAQGVVARSSGNFAQALAYCCKQQQVACTLVLSTTTPEYKIKKSAEHEPRIFIKGNNHFESASYVNEIAQNENLNILRPYDDLSTILGNATLGYELIQAKKWQSVFCPVGGGSLMSGISSAFHYSAPETKLYAAEPELHQDLNLSFQAGTKKELIAPVLSVADGLRAPCVGSLEWPILKQSVTKALAVSEKQIIEAMQLIYEDFHILVEPSAACALAAFLKAFQEAPKHFKDGNTAIILTGANISKSDFDKLVV